MKVAKTREIPITIYSHLELALQKKIFPKEQANLRICESKKEKKGKKSPNFSCYIVTRLEQRKLINMKCPVKQNFNG